jgi:enoyl-CoA hydratase
MTMVLRSDADGVATLTLNRPEKLNALNPATFHELRAHLDAIATDASVRCVVLTGAGRSFCAGNDLGGIAAGEQAPTRTYQADTIDLLEQLPVPTIAKVRGHCFTGGLELALGCDLIAAASSAQFSDTHATWGLVPVWGMTVRLPERVGVAQAKRMSFTAERVDGDLVAADDELDAAVDRLTAAITAGSAHSHRINKQLYRAAGTRLRLDALAFERTLPYGLPADMGERMAGATMR